MPGGAAPPASTDPPPAATSNRFLIVHLPHRPCHRRYEGRADASRDQGPDLPWSALASHRPGARSFSVLSALPRCQARLRQTPVYPAEPPSAGWSGDVRPYGRPHPAQHPGAEGKRKCEG